MTKPSSSTQKSPNKNGHDPFKHLLSAPYPRVELHPVSLKHLRRGHPWVTADNYTKKFPHDRPFLIGVDHKKHESCLLLNDPTHPKIKARLWSINGDFIEQVKSFHRDFRERLSKSFARRRAMMEEQPRENWCLCYGEADFLPGLVMVLLKDRLIVQSYAHYWSKLIPILQKNIESTFNEIFPGIELKAIAFQSRNHQQQNVLENWKGKKSQNQTHIVSEFGINYQVVINQYYDFGIYTDMAPVRLKMEDWFHQKNVLNLYSYTGAFSLYALKQGARFVTSVDLSSDYLEWLEKNLALNPDLDHTKHLSVASSVEKFLKQGLKDKESYDLIISDPPSASNDGKKVMSALKGYEKTLPLMFSLLAPEGKLVLALNTHQVTLNKYQEKIKSLLADVPYKIEKSWTNDDDYRGIKSFPESQYLKILVITKKNGDKK